LFEEDNEAGKLDKAKEIVGVVLPANEDPALPLNPGEEALDEPAGMRRLANGPRAGSIYHAVTRFVQPARLLGDGCH
jgi:hypothetical protein